MGAVREEVDGGGGVEEVVGVLKYTIRKVKNYCIHINIMYVYHLGGGFIDLVHQMKNFQQ